jgi:hypothetical protein
MLCCGSNCKLFMDILTRVLSTRSVIISSDMSTCIPPSNKEEDDDDDDDDDGRSQ